jgi:hypothetical protein
MSRGKPFEPGNKCSHGRPKGSKNKVTRTVGDVIREQRQNILNKTILDFFRGDKTSKVILNREIFSNRHHSSVKVKLPPTDTLAGIDAASDQVLNAMIAGDLSPQVGRAVLDTLAFKVSTIQAAEHERRIEALESALRTDTEQDSDSRKIFLEDAA